jgi:hypothetical protein
MTIYRGYALEFECRRENNPPTVRQWLAAAQNRQKLFDYQPQKGTRRRARSLWAKVERGERLTDEEFAIMARARFIAAPHPQSLIRDTMNGKPVGRYVFGRLEWVDYVRMLIAVAIDERSSAPLVLR